MKLGRRGLSHCHQDRMWEVRKEGLSDAEIARRLGLKPAVSAATSPPAAASLHGAVPGVHHVA